MDTLECIKTRRSVRRYTDKTIAEEVIKEILEAAITAPSGKNGQPWRFRIVTNPKDIEQLSELSVYKGWMKKAPCFVAVFLDQACSYSYVKDVQSCGAAMQNILLAAHSYKLGACWIGEILSKAKDVKAVMGIENKHLELMGVIALGHPAGRTVSPGRKELEAFFV